MGSPADGTVEMANIGATVAALAPLFRSARHVECDGFPLAPRALSKREPR